MAAALVMETIAFWPVWRWYWIRIGESPEEMWAFAALVTAMFYLLRQPARQGSLAIPAAGLSVYAIAYVFLSPVFRGALASLILGATVWSFRETPRAKGGIAALLLMSTPAMASLEFVLGFPLRVIAAQLASLMIASCGFAVERQGTLLQAGAMLVEVDAPCSGVRMLWAALYLAFTLSCRFALPAHWMALAAAGAVVASNAVRASALFFLETGRISLPASAHTATGMAAFLLAAGLLLALIPRSAWSTR